MIKIFNIKLVSFMLILFTNCEVLSIFESEETPNGLTGDKKPKESHWYDDTHCLNWKQLDVYFDRGTILDPWESEDDNFEVQGYFQNSRSTDTCINDGEIWETPGALVPEDNRYKRVAISKLNNYYKNNFNGSVQLGYIGPKEPKKPTGLSEKDLLCYEVCFDELKKLNFKKKRLEQSFRCITPKPELYPGDYYCEFGEDEDEP